MTGTEPESGTEPETGTGPDTDAVAGTSLSELFESGDIELETGMMVLHEDMQQVHTDLQAICCFSIIFLIIQLCHYIYRFFKMFF